MTKGAIYTRAQLRECKLPNSWDIARAAGNKVFIAYSNDTSRSGHGMCVQVVGIACKTDPGASWYEDGCKAFHPRSIKDKAFKVLLAQEWASLQGYVSAYTAWERDPYGGWHPKGSIKKAMQKEEA